MTEQEFNPAIVIPSYDGQVMAEVLAPLIHAAQAGIPHGIHCGESLISRMRSKIATAWESKASHLLWIDSDVVFTFDHVMRAFEGARRYNCVVSGFYPKRAVRDGWAVQIADSSEVVSDLPEGYTNLAACGFGFVVTPTWLFQKIRERYELRVSPLGIVPYFLPRLNGDGEFVGEDWTFCAMARALGCAVLGDRSIVLKHRGSFDYDESSTGGPLPRTWEEQRELEDRWFDAEPT